MTDGIPDPWADDAALDVRLGPPTSPAEVPARLVRPFAWQARGIGLAVAAAQAVVLGVCGFLTGEPVLGGVGVASAAAYVTAWRLTA